ncbi:LPXTG cell wall anchor domain-containing protein [Oceanobacillus salinisoli]|uniref:LPXTG cell wall anchor domain-containing protein n=1 Tax=Oceanobacillus salinisoli TaxID=2678611 RepID=UPI0018CC3945|nr:LPXTG cell wall anchor domain-containing protein [Oceanobacillus salinisoli]
MLRHIDDEGNVTDSKEGILSYDKNTGKIVAEVHHFSAYGIFEVPGSGDESKMIIVEKDSSDGEAGGAGAKVSSKSEGNQAEKSSTGNNNGSVLGDKLPDTATNMFSIIGIGVILLLSGLLGWIWTRKPA